MWLAIIISAWVFLLIILGLLMQYSAKKDNSHFDKLLENPPEPHVRTLTPSAFPDRVENVFKSNINNTEIMMNLQKNIDVATEDMNMLLENEEYEKAAQLRDYIKSCQKMLDELVNKWDPDI